MTSKKNKKINTEAAGWLLKPLKLEVKNNYSHHAVAGGLEKWVPRLTAKLVEQADFREEDAMKLLAPLQHYSQLSPGEREKKLKELFQLYKELVTPSKSKGPLKVTATSKKKMLNTEHKGTSSSSFKMDKLESLDDPVQYLKGVGPKRAATLKKLHLHTVRDLLQHYPRDWQDRQKIQKINTIKPGQTALIEGTVRAKGSFAIRRGLNLTKVVLQDETGRVDATWFNQPYIKDRFKVGQRVLAYGKIEFYRGWQISNPECEIFDDEQDDHLHTNRIVPIYSLTEALTQRFLRTLMHAVLKAMPETLPEIIPEKIKVKLNLIDGRKALQWIHFPDTIASLEKARERLIFEELLLQQLAVCRLKEQYQHGRSTPLAVNGPLFQLFLKGLPFELTGAQKRAIALIQKDLVRTRPMHRLLQGDVGSGKTIVAVITALAAIDSGYQAAIMAPTEVLATQHYLNLQKWLEPMGIRLALFTSGLKGKERRDAFQALAMGDIQIAVGTHALTQEHVVFDSLKVAIIDEQHRFGVEQRSLLRSKGEQPHVLVMTATPIPRTLALTVYGDLDVTVINELPPGRMPIVTRWLKRKEGVKAYDHIKKEVQSGHQAYIIFPLIEESEKLELKALTVEYERLSQSIFPDIKIGLLHGRLSGAEKDEVMSAFKEGSIQILASTTVVEVGVDVPNATIIAIEDADRFGLAALHQLRGRVGRGKHASACYVIADPKTEEGRSRMKIISTISDGFKLSEEDLALRGPGEFFGIKQHGLPDLKLASLIRDAEKVEIAREKATEIIEIDPELSKKEHKDLKTAYFSQYSVKEQHARTG